MHLLDLERYSCLITPCPILKPWQTLPSVILQEERRKAKKLSSRSTSSTSLLEDNDVPRYHATEDTWRHSGNTFVEPERNVEAPQPPPLRALLVPQILIPSLNYGVLSFCDMSIQVLMPLMWSTSLKHDGLGFPPYTIGLAFGIYGIANVLIQVILLSKFIRYFGPRNVYIVNFAAAMVSFSCFPLEKYLARRAGGADWRVWIVITVHLAMSCMVCICYSESNFLQMLANIQ